MFKDTAFIFLSHFWFGGAKQRKERKDGPKQLFFPIILRVLSHTVTSNIFLPFRWGWDSGCGWNQVGTRFPVGMEAGGNGIPGVEGIQVGMRFQLKMDFLVGTGTGPPATGSLDSAPTPPQGSRPFETMADPLCTSAGAPAFLRKGAAYSDCRHPPCLQPQDLGA